jgi:hypothetical protein
MDFMVGYYNRAMSCFFLIEVRWVCCHRFIFRQYFAPSPLLSSRNWNIESTPPPQATLLGLSDSHPLLLYKDHHNIDHSLHHSTASPFCLLPSQSTMLSELHSSSSFSFTAVSCPSSLHTMTPLSLPRQLINIWIHVTRYFETLQHCTGL